MYNNYFTNDEAPFINTAQTAAFSRPIRGLLDILRDDSVIDVHFVSVLDVREAQQRSLTTGEPLYWKTYVTTAYVFYEKADKPSTIELGKQYTFMPSLLAQIVDAMVPDRTVARLQYHLNKTEGEATWEPKYGHVIFEPKCEEQPRTYLHLGKVSHAIGASVASEVNAHNSKFSKQVVPDVTNSYLALHKAASS